MCVFYNTHDQLTQTIAAKNDVIVERLLYILYLHKRPVFPSLDLVPSRPTYSRGKARVGGAGAAGHETSVFRTRTVQ